MDSFEGTGGGPNGAARGSRPRVAMVSSAYYPTDPRLRRQAEALVAHGYDVDVICQRQAGESATAQIGGVSVFRTAGVKYRGSSLAHYALAYARFFVNALVVLTRRYIRYGYAAVQVYSMPEVLVFTALWPRLAGVPLIYDAGDLTVELYASKFGSRGGWLAAGMLRAQERLCLGFANLIVTVHEEYRRRLLARGVPAARLLVVMNLPDDRLFERVSHDQTRSEARSDEFVLVHHGSLVERYGVDLAVRAVASLRERIPALSLRIYGEGDLRPRLEELIERLHLTDRVILHPGYVPLEQLVPLLAVADAAVVPTRADPFTDTILPNKLLEYLALGLPTVVTRTRTVLAHVPEETVEYCEPSDVGALARAIERVCADPGHRQGLAANARAFSVAHPWEKEAAAYCAAVDALIAGRAAPNPRLP
jgi:glycosyltransferase involved in cell wall biosynthesis